MLTPDYLRNMCNKLRIVADDMEEDMLAAIIAALLAGDTVETITAELVRISEWYQYEGLQEIRRIITQAVETSTAIDAEVMERGQLPRDVLQEIPEEPQETPQDATQAPGAEDLPQPQEQAPKTPRPAPQVDAYTRNTAEHFYRTTGGTWVNLTETEAYAGTEKYVDAVDRATTRAATGEVSPRKAVEDAARELAEQGLEVVTTEGGRPEHASTAAERNVRTAVARLAGDIALQTARENGFTLVLVSAHYGARPTHEVWQGKVYSINGDTTKYEDFWQATEYGQMLGLCGINCRHSFSPFAEGMRNPYEGKDYSDPHRYKDEQTQRAMERNIRDLRRKKRAIDEIYRADKSDDVKAERATLAADLRQAIAEYEEFCRVHDFRPLWERTRV